MLIYACKAESVRPYVEKICGWDEDDQEKDFDADFSHIEQFHVIEVDGRFAGFVQYYFKHPYFEVVEIHLLPEYRGKGIGSDILRYLQKACIAQDRKICIGCFKENHRAKALYQKLGFMQTEETDTHYILESPNYTIIPYDEHDRVIGCIGYNSIPGTTEVKLHRLYIKAARKRQGIGTRLLHTVELHLQEQGKTAAHVHLGGKEYFESRSFYPKHGYQEYAPRMMKKEL